MRRRSVVRDTIQMTVIQFFLECLALLFNAWMTRRVGAATVGTLALAGSFFNLAAMVAGGNAMLCASRFVSEELGKPGGCPPQIPLLTTWYSLLLTALIVLAVIPLSLCAALVGGLFTFALAVFQDVPTALMQLGMGLGCGGIAALVTYPIWIACKNVVKFALFTTKKMWHFVTKGDDTP